MNFARSSSFLNSKIFFMQTVSLPQSRGGRRVFAEESFLCENSPLSAALG